ncbi:unnamed protein product [Periconia digitata]|uniref:Uncharacterized protein n=1 Tax=Periconia digitata TaxID=1303443 RepID=A0A9W4U647_9PLEO|nr:unnamed protein product [Periconia digitata]
MLAKNIRHWRCSKVAPTGGTSAVVGRLVIVGPYGSTTGSSVFVPEAEVLETWRILTPTTLLRSLVDENWQFGSMDSHAALIGCLLIRDLLLSKWQRPDIVTTGFDMHREG